MEFQAINYLNTKTNSMSNNKNVATLSNVFSIIINCLLSAGKNLINLSIRNNLNVRNTDTPLPSIMISV